MTRRKGMLLRLCSQGAVVPSRGVRKLLSLAEGAGCHSRCLPLTGPLPWLLLLLLGRHLDALRIADAIGKQFDALDRVLAAELSAEAMRASAELKRSEEFYQFALDGLRTLVSGSGSWLDPACPQVKARIEKALAAVRALLEAERYGEGFVRYRAARKRHLEQKAVPEAILLYEDLSSDFPGAVYGEAGDAYACLALFELRAQAISAAVQQRSRELSAIELKLREARRIQAPARVIERLTKQVAAAQRYLVRLRALPADEAGAAAAHQQGLKLAEKRPFGLYRGEILVRLARDAFYRQLDPRQAQTLYDRAWRWLAEVRAHDAAIASFEVPAKARQVSQPPRTEIASEDVFGNMRPSAIAPAAIVNRRTSPWYLDDLREQCAMALGFLAFHRGENDAAIQWYARLPALDQKTATLEKRNDWNNSRRLKWGAENGYLYAFPEELRPFSQHQRFAVLLADFHYVTERFTAAQAIYHRLLQGEFGRLSPQAADYPLYASASCTYRTQGRQEGAKAYLNVVQRRSRSLTGDRALHSAGMLLINMGAPSMRRQGEELLKTLASSPRRNDFVYRGRLNYGLYLAETGRDREADRVLQGFPPHAAEYTKIAKFLLKDAQTRARARAMAQSGASQGVSP